MDGERRDSRERRHCHQENLNILCRSAGVKDGDVEKVKYLIKYGAKLDLTDKVQERVFVFVLF